MHIVFRDKKDKLLSSFNITNISCCCAGVARAKLQSILDAVEDKANTYAYFDSEFWEQGFFNMV